MFPFAWEETRRRDPYGWRLPLAILVSCLVPFQFAVPRAACSWRTDSGVRVTT
jgi:hypothetical protein